MEFILPTVKLFTFLGIGMIVLGALVFIGIFKGSRSRLNYIIGGIICIAIGIVILFNKTAGSITIAEDQITLKAALTKTQVVRVDEIKKAWVEELENSEWRPAKKKSGSAIGPQERPESVSGSSRKSSTLHRSRPRTCVSGRHKGI